MPERHWIKYFAPGWFAVVMGTGGLGNILFQWRNVLPAGRILGSIIAAVADIAYFVILLLWTLRWLRYYEYVRRDLHHPVAVNFFPTMPVATIIVGTNIYLIWSAYLGEALTYYLVIAAWIISVAGVALCTLYNTFRLLEVEAPPKPETMNFSWIMAPIANMALLLIGNPLLSMTIKLHPSWAMSIFMINLAVFGIGFFLFIFIGGVIFVRLVHHPLPPAELTPSFGIALSAVGLAVSAIIDSGHSAQAMGLILEPVIANVAATTVWGFGFWIIGTIILISLYQLGKGGIPFSLGWWAFIFPLAAYTISSQKIATAFPTMLTHYIAIGLTILLMVLWIYTFGRTLRGVITAELFTGLPISEAKEFIVLAMEREEEQLTKCK